MSNRVRRALARVFPGVLLIVIGLLASLFGRGRGLRRSVPAPVAMGRSVGLERTRTPRSRSDVLGLGALGLGFFGLTFLALVLGLGWILATSDDDSPIRRFLIQTQVAGERPRAALSPKTGLTGGTESGSTGPKIGVPAEVVPTFDTVRVEPNGDWVVAGRAAPNRTLELLVDGKPVAQAMTDADGAFAIVPPALPTGTSDVGLRVVDPQRPGMQQNHELESSERVAVVVSSARNARPLVALTTPDRPTRVLSQSNSGTERVDSEWNAPSRNTTESGARAFAAAPGATLSNGPERRTRSDRAKPSGPPPAIGEKPEGTATGSVGSNSTASGAATASGGDASAAMEARPARIISVDARSGGKLFVSGQAAAGSTIRLYLNETLIAPARVGRDGSVSFSIGGGVKPGTYSVRLDQIDGASGKVRSRVEVPFSVPEPMRSAETEPAMSSASEAGAGRSAAEPPAQARRDPPVPEPNPATVFVPEIRTARIARGDSLWAISRRIYGEGDRYTAIYDANQDQIRDPDLIYPGQVFVLPSEIPPGAEEAERRG